MYTSCPCGSQKEFILCCQPLISGQKIAQNALELMKSRYSAYVTHDADYLIATWHEDYRYPALAESIISSFDNTEWLGLTIVAAPEDSANEGSVEFIAKFRDSQTQKDHAIYERSQFINQNGYWYYTTGIKPSVGRNDTCPCGSMQKYKKCCGR
ncbi:MAG: SEC-C domain-containing protein [Enterobacteriaceae bacterium]|nr:SEC-C domain-containing protein [Enterobacteriaceae bacterium]